MVAKITTPESLHRALYYNEHKVAEKSAECIFASNFLKEAAELNLVEKKQRFDQLTVLNLGTERNTLHVSLNFAPGENLSKDRLIEIAEEYMEGLGFGDQPFLVYQHRDAGHPHIHIVSTNIRDNGDRIDMNFIGRDKSEPVRKAIEEKYRLVKAEDWKRITREPIKPISPEKLQYGRSETKRAIINVLQYVIEKYGYRSLAELNAVLKLYNLRADPGKPGSRIHEHGGLVYQMLDPKGQGIGVPIKASSIFFKPGLQYLGKKFQANKALPPETVKHIQFVIDSALRSRPESWEKFAKALLREQIHPEPYINAQGFCYGLSFIDLDNKLVLKASDLGKGYSVTAILQRLGLEQPLQLRLARANSLSLPPVKMNNAEQSQDRADLEKAMDILFYHEAQLKLPFEFKQDKKKKKKKLSHHQ